MDRLGYDTLWLAEHHFQNEGYECIPNILLLSVHLAHLTTGLKLGCGFNIAPMWHPLRLAEDFATADILTDGRVTFGVGRCYHTLEVETFGAPLLDQPANRDLFEEQVDIIFKAFNERRFSHHGQYYDLPPKVSYRGYELEELTLVPRPRSRPVDCWQPIQNATQRGLDFMVKHGIKGIIGGGVAEGGAMDKVVEAWRDALARGGRECELGEDLSIGFHYYIADTQEKAIKQAAKYFEENLKVFGQLRLIRSLTDKQIEDMSDPKRAPYADLPTLEVAVKAGSRPLRVPGNRLSNRSWPLRTSAQASFQSVAVRAWLLPLIVRDTFGRRTPSRPGAFRSTPALRETPPRWGGRTRQKGVVTLEAAYHHAVTSAA